MGINHVDCHIFLCVGVEQQLHSPSPRCTGCCRPGAKVLCSPLVVLDKDFTLSALDLGLEVKLVVPVGVGGLGGVGGTVVVGDCVGRVVVAIGAQRCVDVGLIVAFPVVVDQSRLVTLRKGRYAVHLEPVKVRVDQAEPVADKVHILDPTVHRGCCELGIVV